MIFSMDTQTLVLHKLIQLFDCSGYSGGNAAAVVDIFVGLAVVVPAEAMMLSHMVMGMVYDETLYF